MIRSIYRVSKKLIDLFGNQEKSVAKEIVFIEYPKEGLWVPGYVTNKVGEMLVLYIPTSPNPRPPKSDFRLPGLPLLYTDQRP